MNRPERQTRSLAADLSPAGEADWQRLAVLATIVAQDRHRQPTASSQRPGAPASQPQPGRPAVGNELQTRAGATMRYDCRMPPIACKTAFDPEALRVLQKAFDLAMVELAGRGVSLDDQLVRGFIAKRIVKAASNFGERDTDRLKHYALQAFET